MVAVKHLLKTASYPENEAFLYCPKRRRLGLVKASFPLTCPFCGLQAERDKFKFVLEYEVV